MMKFLLFLLSVLILNPAMAVLPAQSGFGLQIGISTNGLHALPYWRETNATAIGALWLWNNNASAGTEFQMSGWSFTKQPQVQFMSSNLVAVVDMKNNFTGYRVATFSLTNGDILDSFTGGNDETRSGASCTLTNGGVVFLMQRSSGSDEVFDLMYRRPDNTWWTNLFLLPSEEGIGDLPTRFFSMAELNGEVYVFQTRDGASTLTLTRFAESGGTLVTNYHSPIYIPQNDPQGMNPDGEVPQLVAKVDAANNRILVMYPADTGRFCCPPGCLNIAEGYSKIISVTSDLTRTLLITTPYLGDQHKWVGVFAHSDGPYYMQGNFSSETCSGPFVAVPQHGPTESYTVLDSAFSQSPDDWVAFDSPAGFAIKHLFSPTSKVTIRFFNKP